MLHACFSASGDSSRFRVFLLGPDAVEPTDKFFFFFFRNFQDLFGNTKEKDIFDKKPFYSVEQVYDYLILPPIE